MNAAPPPPENQDDSSPRGALVVVAIGLIACVVAALAATGKGDGEAAHLEWVQAGTAADSKAVAVPGGEGKMQLTETHIRATGTNVSGYSLFTVGSTLTVSAGAPIGGGNIVCAVQSFHGTEVAQSSGGLRGTYPRSSEAGIYNQEVPETVLMDFSSHSSELAVLEVLDRPKRFTSEKGVKLEWPKYEVGTEHLDYSIAGKPEHDLELPFFTIWKTKKYAPAAAIDCTLETSAGKASVGTRVALKHPSPPIDEEAEELKAEEKEEREAEEEGE
ncbi:MAG TPA: hypothetical protein VFJ61_11875 [Solirubrobacterales bacterium]|nr:hypothetical protein [Solirubrobacterales bacterium]